MERRTGTIYTYFGKVTHAIINKKRFYYFLLLHRLYKYKQNTLKQVKTVPVLKTSLLNIKYKRWFYRDAFWNFVSYLNTKKNLRIPVSLALFAYARSANELNFIFRKMHSSEVYHTKNKITTSFSRSVNALSFSMSGGRGGLKNTKKDMTILSKLSQDYSYFGTHF